MSKREMKAHFRNNEICSNKVLLRNRACLMTAFAVVIIFSVFFPCHIYGQDGIVQFQKEITCGGEKFTVNVVKVKIDRVKLRVGLAHDRVGPTENLADIAIRNKAIAAINASFFDAYTSNPIKNPHHTVVINGNVEHIGNVGTLCWFTTSNEVKMERLKFSIEGSINGSFRYPQRWYAYWLNRYPTADTITIFTPIWGRSTGLFDGIQVVVSKSVVKRVEKGGPREIPRDGFVIYFRNMYSKLHQKFQPGDRVEYRVVLKNGLGSDFWGQVYEGVGAGPLLVQNGKISLDPISEGFSSPKIISWSCARSAIGLTGDGYMLMVTTAGTMEQLAEIMRSLGCRYAMNLDGGASSSLWYRGKYITLPGRQISNALLVLEGKPGATGTPVPSPLVVVTPYSTPLTFPAPTREVTISPTVMPYTLAPTTSPKKSAGDIYSRHQGVSEIYIIVTVIVGLLIISIFIFLVIVQKGKSVKRREESSDESSPDNFLF